jgi:hypothetical protein
MAHFVIEFDWARDPKGYHLERRSKRLRVVRNGTGYDPKVLHAYRPLAATDVLFQIFATNVTTPDRMLEFVERFGPFTGAGWDPKIGDDVELVMLQANYMRKVLRSWAGYQKRLNRPLGPPPTGAFATLDAMVVWDPTLNALKWQLRPRVLLDALWLQLGQAITAGLQIRICEHCGNWFEAGRGTGRRLDAKFCSDEHRIAFNSLKRSKEN